MISHAEAQELHELIGASLEIAADNHLDSPGSAVDCLTRARELAALVVSDTAAAYEPPTAP